MTVAELIEKLKELPQDHRVVIDGYEGGLEDVEDAGVITIQLHRNTETYYGPHEDASSHRARPNYPDTVPAVHLW